MAIDTVHYTYPEFKQNWTKLRVCFKGQDYVKRLRTTYLPATRSMEIDGMGAGQLGAASYEAYLTRAVFPDYVSMAVEAYLGLLHANDATIELPAAMEPLRDKATLYGESLQMLLMRINEEQLITGRVGLLLDMPTTPNPTSPMPFIALYIADAIRNWDDASIEEGTARLNLVVLDESGYKRDTDFQWVLNSKYRVLMLGKLLENEAENAAADYQQAAFENEGGIAPMYDESLMKTPLMRGQTLKQIPFVFINSKNIVSDPDDPPLLGLANDCLTIYRGEADYRHSLFMQGQDTFVISGERKRSASEIEGSAAVRVGAGSLIELDAGGTAQYVGVNSAGIPEQRLALEADRKRSETRAAQLLDKSGVESGDALRTRVGAQTNSLTQIAKTGAMGLEKLLKIAAEWMGANPDEVKVTPNTDFGDVELSSQGLVQLMQARAMGAPISKRSLHANLSEKKLARYTYEEELEYIAQEAAEDPNLGEGEELPLPGDQQQDQGNVDDQNSQ